jgi:hypothetical protein
MELNFQLSMEENMSEYIPINQDIINLLLDLKFALDANDDSSARKAAQTLVIEQAEKQYPQLREGDPILYRQVLEITVSLLLERLKAKLLAEKKMAA